MERPGISDPLVGSILINTIVTSPATIIYTAIDSICSVNDTLLITLAISPTTAPLWPGDTLCRMVPYTFINPDSPADATWDFGDTTPLVMGDTVQHFFQNIGTFWVTATIANAAGCTTKFDDTITVTDIPLSLFTINADTLCEGDSILVLNSNPDAAYTTYTWSANAIALGSLYEPGWYTYLLATDTVTPITILQEATNGCGTTTFSDTYVIYPLPVAGFDVDQSSGCSPDTVLFSNISTGNPETYAWYINGVFITNDSILAPQIFLADSTDSILSSH
ncbi:MAG: hypothetical protein IPK10_00840 [Bacteroidetes bacterium]|nr:hypothetical protein [Bacteroidota bacterium]